MPIFGDQTSDYPLNSPLNDNIVGGKYSCPEAGVAQSISFYLGANWSQGVKVKCAIYNADYTLLGVTEERTTGGADGSLQQFNFSEPKPILAIADYILVCWSEDEVFVESMFNAPANSTMSRAYSYNGFPEPIGSLNHTYYKAIFCTYEEAPLIEVPTVTTQAATGIALE